MQRFPCLRRLRAERVHCANCFHSSPSDHSTIRSCIEAGSGGFVINGVSAVDLSGTSVSGAGDVNGDGLDDLIIGARSDDPNGINSGASFVVFGKTNGCLLYTSPSPRD